MKVLVVGLLFVVGLITAMTNTPGTDWLPQLRVSGLGVLTMLVSLYLVHRWKL